MHYSIDYHFSFFYSNPMKNTNTNEKAFFQGHLLEQNPNIILPEHFSANFPLHWHRFVEILACPADAQLTNKPTIQLNQETFVMNPGDIVFIWSGELHSISHNDDSTIVGIQCSSSLFNELTEFAQYLHLFRTFHHMKSDEYPELTMQLWDHIKRMSSTKREGKPFWGIEALISLYEMFIDFGMYIRNNMPLEMDESAENNTYLKKVMVACNYITENCEQPLSLGEVAGYVGFSECYFSKLFKKATKLNFVEYVTMQRIKQAQGLLAETSTPITDIAYKAGFKSISTFNRVFKEYRGCSPTEYRKYYVK